MIADGMGSVTALALAMAPLRLSCQIPFIAELNGVKVKIAWAD